MCVRECVRECVRACVRAACVRFKRKVFEEDLKELKELE